MYTFSWEWHHWTSELTLSDGLDQSVYIKIQHWIRITIHFHILSVLVKMRWINYNTNEMLINIWLAKWTHYVHVAKLLLISFYSLSKMWDGKPEVNCFILKESTVYTLECKIPQAAVMEKWLFIFFKTYYFLSDLFWGLEVIALGLFLWHSGGFSSVKGLWGTLRWLCLGPILMGNNNSLSNWILCISHTF